MSLVDNLCKIDIYGPKLLWTSNSSILPTQHIIWTKLTIKTIFPREKNTSISLPSLRRKVLFQIEIITLLQPFLYLITWNLNSIPIGVDYFLLPPLNLFLSRDQWPLFSSMAEIRELYYHYYLFPFHIPSSRVSFDPPAIPRLTIKRSSVGKAISIRDLIRGPHQNTNDRLVILFGYWVLGDFSLILLFLPTWYYIHPQFGKVRRLCP